MGKNNPEILVYITDNKERVLSGDPLTLYMCDKEEREKCLVDLSRALRGNVIELKNGDHMIISN